MRLGGPVLEEFDSPDQWVEALRSCGYSAAYCPLDESADSPTIAAYAEAAAAADIVIAEVGAWSNPLAPDEQERKHALTLCQQRLALADEIGARCCVNIAGSRGEQWDGHHPDNLTEETFDLIVETVRTIIDAVQPQCTFYTLETMPWMYPDSAESYVQLIKAIQRDRFAVHFDPTNLVCSPQRYYRTGELIRDFSEKLGPHIKSCHAKDIRLSDKFMVYLDEVRPGTGGLDYSIYLWELSKLDPDMPLMLEHLPSEEEYQLAAQYVRRLADELGIMMK